MKSLRLLAAAMAALVLSAAPAAALQPDALLAPVSDAHPDADGPHKTHQAAANELAGTFRITAGACSGAVSGSYFRMIQPGGTLEAGPWVENSDSPCADKTYTPLKPGSDNGLISGAYQPQPASPFDTPGNGTAARIVAPTRFFGVDFAVATNSTDPQTSRQVPAPVLRRDGSRLSGDVRAVGVAWNRQHFNQGAPKPDGSMPGLTRAPQGSIDAGTKAYTLTWSSTISGGPFNNFTGVWHLEGVFDGSLSGAAPAAGTDSGASDSGTSTAANDASGSGAPGPATPRTGPAVPALAGAALLLAGARGLARRRRDA